MVTILVYTGISFRLAFAKRMMKYENDATKAKFMPAFAHRVKNDDTTKKKRYNPEASGWFSECVPYVSNIAWSTLDLANLYVSPSYLLLDNILFYLRFACLSLLVIHSYGTSKPKN